jgi:ABC-type phosphate transport system substrate-binding protein
MPAIVLFFLISLLALSASGVADSRQAHDFRVIVHPSNPATAVRRQFLEDAFLKKVTRWPGDGPIKPVDIGPRSAARTAFSKAVLRRSTAAIRSYWQQLIFAGRDVPPPELASDAEIVEYVLQRPGGLGYVSASADVGAAKLVELQD